MAMRSGAKSAVQAVVLAGGKGTRLRACVPERPKPMALVAGRPFLEWLLCWLRHWGIREVLLCVGYRAETIRSHFGGGSAWGLRIGYSEEQTPLGTGGALRLALPRLVSDPVLVLNGDSYCEAPLDRFLAFHRQRDAGGSLLLVPGVEPRRYGSVAIDDEGRVVRFCEKAAGTVDPWVSAGLYLLAPGLLATIPAGRYVSLEREMFPWWLSRLAGFAGEWPFLDIGTPESYRQAQAFLAGRQVGGATLRVKEISV